MIVIPIQFYKKCKIHFFRIIHGRQNNKYIVIHKLMCIERYTYIYQT